MNMAGWSRALLPLEMEYRGECVFPEQETEEAPGLWSRTSPTSPETIVE
jgi:hypothetical protein